NRRSIGEKRRIRFACQAGSEFPAVEFGRIALKLRGRRRPHAPPWVLHLILEAPAVRLRGITPVVLGDELLDRAFGRKLRTALTMDAQFVPTAIDPPPVLRRSFADAMAHRQGNVVFMESHAGHFGDRVPGNDFPDEDDASLHRSGPDWPHIEPE